MSRIDLLFITFKCDKSKIMDIVLRYTCSTFKNSNTINRTIVVSTYFLLKVQTRCPRQTSAMCTVCLGQRVSSLYKLLDVSERVKGV